MYAQFGGTMGERMKSVYGAFCSRHNDALQIYKALLKSDVTFQEFIKVSRLDTQRKIANFLVELLSVLRVCLHQPKVSF